MKFIECSVDYTFHYCSLITVSHAKGGNITFFYWILWYWDASSCLSPIHWEKEAKPSWGMPLTFWKIAYLGIQTAEFDKTKRDGFLRVYDEEECSKDDVGVETAKAIVFGHLGVRNSTWLLSFFFFLPEMEMCGQCYVLE